MTLMWQEIKIQVLWYVMPCGVMCSYRRFESSLYVHLQGEAAQEFVQIPSRCSGYCNVAPGCHLLSVGWIKWQLQHDNLRHLALWRRISKQKCGLVKHRILDLWTNSLGFVSVWFCKGQWRNGVGHRIWRGRHCTELDFSGRLCCSANCKFSSKYYLWFFLLSLTLVSLWSDVMEEIVSEYLLQGH
jgi:hypothetical protein